MDICNIAFYLLLGLGFIIVAFLIGIIIVVFFIWTLFYVAQDDAEMERERRLRDGT